MPTLSDPMHRRLAATRAAATSRSAPPKSSGSPELAPVRAIAPPARAEASGLEGNLIRVLVSPSDPALTVREAYACKERALYDLIAAAPFMDVWTLHKRVTVGRSDDPFVIALQRLAPERRTKVVAFMADARRREALRAS